MILLDSSIIIELFRKTKKEQTAFYKLVGVYQSLFISSITNYEIGIGNRTIVQSEYWNKLKQNLEILPFDESCSEIAKEIYLNLLNQNKIIDIADILIGSTALNYNLPIATLNVKHFSRIEGLKVINQF